MSIAMTRTCRFWTLVVIATVFYAATSADAEEAALAGLWESHRILGPADSGRLVIRELDGEVLAEFGPHRIAVSFDGDALSFATPNGGHFVGKKDKSNTIRGHWLQPPSSFDGNVFATPVALHRGTNSWHGEVAPQPDLATFYLVLRPDAESLTADLINPERNLGLFYDLTRVTRDNNSLLFHGSFLGRGQERVMLEGSYDESSDVITLHYPGRGGSYDFQRSSAGQAAGYLAKAPGTPVPTDRPPVLNDGWKTATFAEVAMDPAPILEMIESEILPAPDSSRDLSIHSVLIARNGKLVFEEYFHGYHRDLPHDSRSASKSVASILAAAVMDSGIDLNWDTPVYASLGMSALLEREPARGDMTLRHLVNMNTGLDCDDRNPESAANEDVLWDNADDLDFYQHTLNVGILHAPGAHAAYCSAGANLVGAVLASAADESLLRLIDRLIAKPLDIHRYSVPVPPDGHPYMGGGARWLPRDFLKFPQMMLDGGRWNGRQIISRENAELLVTPAVKLDGDREYGYLWWTEDYPKGDATVRAHFMAGNGGQIAMLIPALQLSIVFNAGNYSDRVFYRIQQELIPKYILPAVTN